MNGPDIARQHKQYQEARPGWQLIEDVLAGARRIKSKGTEYLPMPNPSDVSTENKARYDSYKQRALFYEATGRTFNGLVGEVFAKETTYELPKKLEPYDKNIDGTGVTLDQQSKQAFGYGLSMGRCGLLADFPSRAEGDEGPATVEDLERGSIRPKVSLYGPKAILNWGLGNFGALALLDLVVLEEVFTEEVQGEQKEEKQYRRLRLSASREYFVEIWKENKSNASFEMTSSTIPRQADGVTTFDHIPFHFIGSVDNSPTVDPAPLEGLATVNVHHYIDSADYQWSVYQVGMPTIFISGLTQEWIDSHYPKGKFQFGSSLVMLLPKDGTAGIIQPDPNTMAKEAMEHKEKLMVALGAKLVDEKSVERTATEAGMDKATETSVLGTVAQNTSYAYRAVLLDATMFVDMSVKEVEFDLNTDFDIAKMDPSERAQLMAEWQADLITFSEARTKLRKAGIATLTDEEAKAESLQEFETDPTNPQIDPKTGKTVPEIDPVTGLPPKPLPAAKKAAKKAAR